MLSHIKKQGFNPIARSNELGNSQSKSGIKNFVLSAEHVQGYTLNNHPNNSNGSFVNNSSVDRYSKIKGQHMNTIDYSGGVNANKSNVSSNSNKQTWSQVIKIVQNANLKESQIIKKQQNNRKIAYKNQLDQQVEQINTKFILEQSQKQRQRTQIQDQVRQQKIYFNNSKIKKIKTQQKYRAQNLELINSQSYKNRHNYNLKLQDKDSKAIQYKQHPFVSLVDKQDQRMRQTKNNFLLQNKLNDIQIAIHKQLKKEENDCERKTRKEFQNYVENQFKKHEQDRLMFKNKYLGIKKFQANANIAKTQSNSPQSHQKNTEPTEKSIQKKDNIQSIQKKYINFLDHQVQQLKSRKIKQKELDNRSSQINRHVQIPDSSPAYLGRIGISNDRKKQLNILDHNLYNHGRIKRKQSRNGSRYRNFYNPNNLHTSQNINEEKNNKIEGFNKVNIVHRSVEISPRVEYNHNRSTLNSEQLGEKQSQKQRNTQKIQRRAHSNMKLLPSIQKQTQIPYRNLYSQFSQYKNKLQAVLHKNEPKQVYHQDQTLFQNNRNGSPNSANIINMNGHMSSDIVVPVTLTKPNINNSNSPVFNNTLADQPKKQRKSYKKYDFITGSHKIMFV